MLKRSLVDASVGTPEHLCFEGAPDVRPPFHQFPEKRQAVHHDGAMLDSLAACPPLNAAERAKLDVLLAQERQRVAPEAEIAAAAYEAATAREIATAAGRAEPSAADLRAAKRARDGHLLASFVLPWDDAALAGKTVGDVLADPARFIGETLADPLEGSDYGACKAKVLQGRDGRPFINSFAHGGIRYELFWNAAAVQARLDGMDKAEAVEFYADLGITADLDKVESAEIRKKVHEISGVGVRDLDKAAKESMGKHAAARLQEQIVHRKATRKDPRPQVQMPGPDDEIIPLVNLLNDVLGGSKAPEPPMRDIDGNLVEVRVRAVPNMHALRNANGDDEPGGTEQDHAL